MNCPLCRIELIKTYDLQKQYKCLKCGSYYRMIIREKKRFGAQTQHGKTVHEPLVLLTNQEAIDALRQ